MLCHFDAVLYSTEEVSVVLLKEQKGPVSLNVVRRVFSPYFQIWSSASSSRYTAVIISASFKKVYANLWNTLFSSTTCIFELS